MSIKDLIIQFNNGATKGTASDKRVRIEGNKLINYNTIIAIRNNDGTIQLNNRKYSRTTSKLQGTIRLYANVTSEFYGENATIYYSW